MRSTVVLFVVLGVLGVIVLVVLAGLVSDWSDRQVDRRRNQEPEEKNPPGQGRGEW